MGMLCAVSFNRYGRLYYVDPGDLTIGVGDLVMVPSQEDTADGPLLVLAECIWAAQWVSEETSGFPLVARVATDADREHDRVIRSAKADAKVAAKKLIREHDLPMKVIAVDHVMGAETGARTTIYFTAPHRVDFRALVRDLGATLRCRVELRQVSARDSAKVQGGIGSCGRDLCCATFLTDFEPVTVRMAKDQDLPLNPMRISGACGRLMCCLKYEHPLYELSHTTPRVGETVETVEGTGRVISRFAPGESVGVKLHGDGRTVRCGMAEACGSRRAFEQR